jgi:predicted RNase H-like nuclease
VTFDQADPGLSPLDAPCAVGLDGCRSGWIAAVAHGPAGSPARTELRRFRDFDQLLAWRDGQSSQPVVAADVPMGLPDRAGLRPCDREARARLGPRWMCVFEAPDRQLFGHDFEAAKAIVHARRGADPRAHILTRQGVQIMAKIEEVDRVLQADRSRERWLVEVHPELSFRELASDDLPRKKSSAGKHCRLALLRALFRDVDKRLEAAPWPRKEVGYDDILDAYASLWSALRFGRGAADCLELGGESDACGLIMRMIV